MIRINGKGNIGGLVIAHSDWFVKKRHCARATYQHTTEEYERPAVKVSKTDEKAQAEARWAEENIPDGTSDSEYMRIMAAQFGGSGDEQGELFDEEMGLTEQEED
jgi:hypothetical protein